MFVHGNESFSYPRFNHVITRRAIFRILAQFTDISKCLFSSKFIGNDET